MQSKNFVGGLKIFYTPKYLFISLYLLAFGACIRVARPFATFLPVRRIPKLSARLDYPISVLYIHTVRQSEPILRCWYVCEGRFHGGWDGPRMLNHTPNPPKVGSGCDKGPQNSFWQHCNFLFFFFPAKKVIWTHIAPEPLRAVCARLWRVGCIPGRSDRNLATLQPALQRRS